LFATTNEEFYLKSQTGNRRFWPIKVGRAIDIEALKRDRDQLFAEAAAIEATGESLFLDESLWEEAREAQEARRERDPWEDVLADVIGTTKAPNTQGKGFEYRISNVQLFGILDIPLEKQTNTNSKRLATAMKKLGWRKGHVTIDGKQVRGYSKPCSDSDVGNELHVLSTAEVIALRAPG
jgi:predicted P-loop ATPase